MADEAKKQTTAASAATDSTAAPGSANKNGEKAEEGDKNKPPPWAVIWILVVITAIFGGAYGYAVAPATAVFIELLLAVAAMTVGGLVGFLFGIPRVLPPKRDGTTSGAEPASVDANSMDFQPSTNLEQVADWLTKILVGVGLVQFSSFGGYLNNVGLAVAKAVKVPGIDIVSQLVIVSFAILGFLATFLWTRLDYQRMQAFSDNGLRSLVKTVERKLSSEVANVATVTDLIAKGKLKSSAQAYSGQLDTAFVGERTTAFQAGWSADLRRKVKEFVEHDPSDYQSDPTATLFAGTPQEANGLRLEAQIEATLKRSLAIKLTVRPTAGRPLDKPVAFLLHPTFKQSLEWVTPENGIATNQIYSAGSFTVVAICDDGDTILSYDLTNLPGAPAWFKAN